LLNIKKDSKIKKQGWGSHLIKLPHNSLFNANWGGIFKKSHNIHMRGGLNINDDYLFWRSEKLLKVNDSFQAFLNDMRADGLNSDDLREILEMMRKK